MSIGYACLTIGVPGSDYRNCTLKNANEENLLAIIQHNFEVLESMIDYNIRNGIKLFRISSEIVPFGSTVAFTIPWDQIYEAQLTRIGQKIIQSGMRVSMHPGQYTVLNSPNPDVVERGKKDLLYHCKFLDAMGLGSQYKLTLHLGGVYGDMESAKQRFIDHYQTLSDNVKERIVLENDGVLFSIEDVLDTAIRANIPVVYDVLHNVTAPPLVNKSDDEWIQECVKTWKPKDGTPKIHYSQQNPLKKRGAHSEYIAIDPFLDFYQSLSVKNVDIMLEVKDKNMSALKCINCVSNRGIHRLEEDWARYKYVVLERSKEIYDEINRLLQDKTTYPAVEMYRLIEEALTLPIVTGSAINTAEHVWGYFKNQASESEKKRFLHLLSTFNAKEGTLHSIKNHLFSLATKYQESYLLNSYYFFL